MQVPKICNHCGKSFIAQTTVTRFCSHKCSQRNYKKRAKEAKIQKSLEDTMTQMVSPSQANVTSISSQTSKDFLCINDISDLLRPEFGEHTKNSATWPTLSKASWT